MRSLEPALLQLKTNKSSDFIVKYAVFLQMIYVKFPFDTFTDGKCTRTIKIQT